MEIKFHPETIVGFSWQSLEYSKELFLIFGSCKSWYGHTALLEMDSDAKTSTRGRPILESSHDIVNLCVYTFDQDVSEF